MLEISLIQIIVDNCLCKSVNIKIWNMQISESEQKRTIISDYLDIRKIRTSLLSLHDKEILFQRLCGCWKRKIASSISRADYATWRRDRTYLCPNLVRKKKTSFWRYRGDHPPTGSLIAQVVRNPLMPVRLIAHRDLPAWIISTFFTIDWSETLTWFSMFCDLYIFGLTKTSDLIFS